MAKPFWGLYEGLSSVPKTGIPRSSAPTAPTPTPEVKATPPAPVSPNNKKRPNETPLAMPRSKRVAMAPRVALQHHISQQQHNNTQQQEEPNNSKKNEITQKPVVVQKRDEEVLNAPIRTSNVTLALQDIKDPYDPSKPNTYREYQDWLQQRYHEEMRRAEEALEASNKAAAASGGGKGGKTNIAENMMKKMGWKGKGHGIGRLEQGMAAPLIAQKSGTGSQGVIINTAAAELEQRSVNPTGSQASRVIVLTNMVGPGEVDEFLTKETAAECEKYGVVLRCHVKEDTRPGVHPDQAVKIYVKFKYQDQALKALMDLDGRFFGGRTVHADYFNEFAFDAM